MVKFRRFLVKSVNLFLCVTILFNSSFTNRVYAEEDDLNQEEISQNSEVEDIIEESEEPSFIPEDEQEPSNEEVFNIPPLTYQAPVFDENTNFVHVKRSNGLLRSSNAIPPSYDSRNVNGVNYITPVKDQNPYGTCWIFASVAAMEADYLKRYPGSNIDLSEYQLAWFSYDTLGYEDPLNLITNDGIEFWYQDPVTSFTFSAPYRVHGIDTFDAGGNAVRIVNLLSSGIGVSDEIEGKKYTDIETNNYKVVNPDRYREGGVFSFSEEDCYKHDYILVESNYYDFSSNAQNNVVKQAIMNHGAVCISMFYDGNATSGSTGSCYNSSNYAYYCPYDTGTNHLVAVVGWDDNFDKNKFNKIYYDGAYHSPNNNGAWLIKNSWGPSWGNQGYFWISYEDRTIHKDKAYSFEIEKEDKTNPYKIYCTDGIMDSDSVTFGTSVSGAKNVAAQYFVPQAKESIEKIGIFSTGADLVYTISLYTTYFPSPETVNQTNLNFLLNFPSVYPPNCTFDVTLDHYGYHLVDVPQDIVVNANQPYVVMFSSISTDKTRSGRISCQGGDYVDNSLGQDFVTGKLYSYHCVNEVDRIWFVGAIQSNGAGALYPNTTPNFGLEGCDLNLKVYTQEISSNASYVVQHYTEDLDGNYSLNGTDSLTGKIGETVTASPITINGFTYNSNNPNNIKSGVVLEDGSLVLKLYYSRNSYKITFDVDGGSAISDATYKYGATITPPSNPTRTGYTFSKWEPAIPATMPANSLTVKAIWNAANVNVYILHYIQVDDGDSYSLKEEETTQSLTGSTITLANKAKSTNDYQYYTYLGGTSYTSKPNNTISKPSSYQTTTDALAGGNRYIALLYKPNKYKLELEKDIGIDKIEVNSGVNLSQYSYNKQITLLAFSKSGYKFLKWQKDGADFTNNNNASYTFNMPGKGVKYKAISTPNTYNIVYELNDGSFPASQQPLTEVNYGVEFTVPNPDKSNYSFTGWSIIGLDNTTHIIDGQEKTGTTLTNITATKFKNLTTADNGTVTFTANYGPKQYSYTVQKFLMDTNGNYPSTPTSTDSSGKGEFDSVIDYSIYTDPEGFTLDTSKSVRPEKINSSSVVVKLYYSRNKYQLSISKNGDTNQTITGAGEYYFGQDVNINVTPSAGYHFVSLKDGSTVLSTNSSYSFKMSAKTYSLTSVCAINSYTIAYDLNYQGATNPTNSSVDYGREIEIQNPTRQYYTFTGWSITGLDNTTHIIGGQEKTGNTLSNITATKFKNLTAVNGGTITFKANWSANTINYTVNIYEMKTDGTYPTSPNSTVTPTPSAVYGSNISYAPPAKTGFTVDNSLSVLSSTLNSDSVVLKVYYKRNSHTITIQSDVGATNITGGGEHLYGASINIQATIKTGYKFIKWTVNGTDKTNASFTYEMPDSDVTIKLVTSPIKYKVVYELNDGLFPASQQPLTEVDYDNEFNVPNPEKEGFSFTGWSITGLDNTTHIIGGQEKTGTTLTNITATKFKNLSANDNGVVTFSAVWGELPVTYIINCYVQDTSGNYVNDSEPYLTNSDQISKGSSVTVTPQEIEGFTFDSEKTGDNLVKVVDADGFTFDLYYSRNKYKVILEKDDGIGSLIGECEDYFDKDVEISCIANEGYSFLKWKKGNDDFAYDNATTVKVLAHDTTYKAISKANTYNITYSLDGGVLAENTPTFATFGNEFIVPHPIKAGYDFVGWYIKGMGGSFAHYLNNQEYSESDYIEGDPIIGENNTVFKNLHSELDAEVIFEANWQARTDTPYSIEHYLELNDASYSTTPNNIESKTGTTDTEVEATSLEFTGYVYDSSSTSTGIVAGDGSLKIKLYYKRKSYKVVFDGNGADLGNVDDSSVLFNSSIKMPANNFVKNDSIFVGWQVETDVENIKCINDNQYIINEAFINKYSIEDTITVKAIWEDASTEPITIPGTIKSGEYTNLTNTSNNIFKTTLTNDNIQDILYPKSSSSTPSSAVTWIEASTCNQVKVQQIASALRSKGVNYKNIYCVEINLFMASDGDPSNGKKVSTTYSPVNLKLDISSNSELVEYAKADSVVVYSIHDGVLQDEIKGTYNKDTSEYSFSTSKFSVYALCALQTNNEDSYHIKQDFVVPDTGFNY